MKVDILIELHNDAYQPDWPEYIVLFIFLSFCFYFLLTRQSFTNLHSFSPEILFTARFTPLLFFIEFSVHVFAVYKQSATPDYRWNGKIGLRITRGIFVDYRRALCWQLSGLFSYIPTRLRTGGWWHVFPENLPNSHCDDPRISNGDEVSNIR